MTARPSGVVLKYGTPAVRDVKGAALQRGDALGHELPAAIDQTRELGAVLARAARNVVVVRLVGLAEIGGVGVRDGALLAHPVNRGARIEAAGERNADLLADGKALKNICHAPQMLSPSGAG